MMLKVSNSNGHADVESNDLAFVSGRFHVCYNRRKDDDLSSLKLESSFSVIRNALRLRAIKV